MKEKMLTRNPYSAILNGKNSYHLNCPKDISIRNWKKGLANRWKETPVEIIFPYVKPGKQTSYLLDWMRKQEVEHCRHPKFRNRFIVPGVNKATWLKMKWSIDNERKS